MSAKEKARELYLQMFRRLPFDKEVKTKNEHGKWDYNSSELAKEHALIAVDEIIKAIESLQYERKTDYWKTVWAEIELI